MIIASSLEDGQGILSLVNGTLIGRMGRICLINVDSLKTIGLSFHYKIMENAILIHNDCINVSEVLTILNSISPEFEKQDKTRDYLAGLGNPLEYFGY